MCLKFFISSYISKLYGILDAFFKKNFAWKIPRNTLAFKALRGIGGKGRNVPQKTFFRRSGPDKADCI
nr:MAG TPA: hypothetical protein [Caudoviricetes sp.]